MAFIGSIIVPHPPIIIPTVGNGREREVQNTIDAYYAAAKQVAQWEPEVLIITSLHTAMYADYFHISSGGKTIGDMSAFGAAQTQLRVQYDIELRQEIISQAEMAGIQAGTLGEKDSKLDHGTFLPLYFLRETGVDCPILRIGLSGFSPLEHYRFGQCIARAVNKLNRRAVFVASGDLSHKLKEDGPYGYAPEGPDFDHQVTQAMVEGDFLQFLTMDPALCDRAAECGLRSFQIMAGALDGLGVMPELLSYEGVTGIGYGVAVFTVTGPDENRRFAAQCDVIIIVGRVKPHTDFKGPVESGLAKMIAIGLAKHEGCSLFHKQGFDTFARRIPMVAKTFLEKMTASEDPIKTGETEDGEEEEDLEEEE